MNKEKIIGYDALVLGIWLGVAILNSSNYTIRSTIIWTSFLALLFEKIRFHLVLNELMEERKKG